VLYKYAGSKNLWERRIAILSTATFIKNKKFKTTLELSDILLNDNHDLIHKAVGWMLREVGKMDTKFLEDYLKPRYNKMPRTMLRYAIEKIPEQKRKKYLKGTIK
jgi:3-methyladenine DNA glycosylase AlkD